MHPAVLRGSKKSRMRMKVPSTTTLSFPTLSPLLTAGKNRVGYFLDSPRSSLKLDINIVNSNNTCYIPLDVDNATNTYYTPLKIERFLLQPKNNHWATKDK
jgi:hypothetical protein